MLEEEDTRNMIRLLGDIAGKGTSLNQKRTSLLNGLAQLISADTWTWSLMGSNPAVIPAPTMFLHRGFDEARLARYLKLMEHPDFAKLTIPFFLALEKKKGHITRFHQQITPDEELQQMQFFPELKSVGMRAAILSGRPTSHGQISVITLLRGEDQELFGPREARIAHILLSEVGWLHDNAWPDHPREGVSALTPRQRTVLVLLLQGIGRKQIALDLNLSLNTVHGYAKEIYERFEVHSHAELIRRFVEGDGGDVSTLAPQ